MCILEAHCCNSIGAREWPIVPAPLEFDVVVKVAIDMVAQLSWQVKKVEMLFSHCSTVCGTVTEESGRLCTRRTLAKG